LVVSGSGLAAVLPAGPVDASTDGGGPSAGVGVASAQTANETTDTNETTNTTSVDPGYQNVTVPIEDTRPFAFGTTVLVREETVLSMTFEVPPEEISGNVSVSNSTSPAVAALAANRSVHRAVDVTVPETATETAATMQLVVRALPVENRENLEVMRYDEATETWQPLETAVISERRWSSDRGASVLLLETKTPGFSTFAVTESSSSGNETTNETANETTNETANVSDIVADSEGPNETDSSTINESDFNPHPAATTVWINDRRPYTDGTTVEIQEETVEAITFAAPKGDIRGYVAVNDSTSTAVDTLGGDRTLLRAVNITATKAASETPATLHLTVRALPFEDGGVPEVLRYNEDTDSWEPLETRIVSERFWSESHGASMFRVDAETPGFSTFAVTEAPETTNTQPEPEPEPADDSSSTESTDDSGLLFGFGLFEIAIVALVIAGGGGAVFVVRRR
jgi:hypothetical protein